MSKYNKMEHGPKKIKNSFSVGPAKVSQKMNSI